MRRAAAFTQLHILTRWTVALQFGHKSPTDYNRLSTRSLSTRSACHTGFNVLCLALVEPTPLQKPNNTKEEGHSGSNANCCCGEATVFHGERDSETTPTTITTPEAAPPITTISTAVIVFAAAGKLLHLARPP
jgi:hypothetical protein